MGLYAGRQWGDLSLRAGAAYTWPALTTDRTVSFTGYADRLTGSYNSGTAQPFAELGYDLHAGAVTLEPMDRFSSEAYWTVWTEGLGGTGRA